MILVLEQHITQKDIERLLQQLHLMKLEAMPIADNGRQFIAVVNGGEVDGAEFVSLPGVTGVLPFTQKYKLAGLDTRKSPSVIDIKGQTIGGGSLTVIAGPCSIESEAQIHEIAALVAASGATILRGGAFKPRTSPYDFQGLGEAGLKYLQQAADAHGLLCVSEVMDTQDIDLVCRHVDIVQIGARNMQNFSLLKQVGKTGKPVLLKRGLAATYMDFLMAAEYIMQTGNFKVILCERGIRTFETHARNTLDIAAVPILHELSHLPVIVDPSHGTGMRSIVPHMVYAAIAAGADGIMVEVHPKPDESVSDAKQTISPSTFAQMMQVARQISTVIKNVE
jgi:3-deoxy-7-phosphoheptulonate synthase